MTLVREARLALEYVALPGAVGELNYGYVTGELSSTGCAPRQALLEGDHPPHIRSRGCCEYARHF